MAKIIKRRGAKTAKRKSLKSVKKMDNKRRRIGGFSYKKSKQDESLTVKERDVLAEQAKYIIQPLSPKEEFRLDRDRGRGEIGIADFPEKYDKDIIILQVRDPWWLHTYWEVRDNTYKKLKNELGNLFDSAKRVLRVYDVSYINFNGSNAHRFFDIELTHNATNWYIDTAGPGRSWCVDIGLRLSDGRFITICRSNTVTTPLDGPSWITDEEWMVPDDLFAKLYTTAVGLGGSPVKLKKPWLELQKRQFASGGLFSVGFSPVKKKVEHRRKFWMVVNTELIVYGATETDAKVTVCGKPVALKSDGTFSLRFSLPEGKQVIPVKAVSSDSIDERTITPIVSRETK